jgi:hypothetical protein
MCPPGLTKRWSPPSKLLTRSAWRAMASRWRPTLIKSSARARRKRRGLGPDAHAASPIPHCLLSCSIASCRSCDSCGGSGVVVSGCGLDVVAVPEPIRFCIPLGAFCDAAQRRLGGPQSTRQGEIVGRGWVVSDSSLSVVRLKTPIGKKSGPAGAVTGAPMRKHVPGSRTCSSTRSRTLSRCSAVGRCRVHR